MARARHISQLFPVLLVGAFAAFFGFGAWNYKPYSDDFYFLYLAHEKGIYEFTIELFRQANGRLFGHFYLAIVFHLFKPGWFFIYHFILLAGFVFALAALIRNYLFTLRNIAITFRSVLGWSVFITAFFFFFYFEEQLETWFWVSATGVHLLSVILAMAGLAVIFSRRKIDLRSGLVFVVFFLAGGLSESYALMYGLVLAAIILTAIQLKLFAQGLISTSVAGILGLAGGLAINLFSEGVFTRFSFLPDFNLLQALKNTAHSLAFPLLRYEYLPLKLTLVALLVFFAKQHYGLAHSGSKRFLREGLLVLGFIAISFFLPCYLLSDIVPARAASLGYLAGVLFLFDQLVLRKIKD